jgi:hypothetical protein
VKPVIWMFSRNINDYSRSIIKNSISVIDHSRVMLQLAVSFIIIIYEHHIVIVQATGVNRS